MDRCFQVQDQRTSSRVSNQDQVKNSIRIASEELHSQRAENTSTIYKDWCLKKSINRWKPHAHTQIHKVSRYQESFILKASATLNYISSSNAKRYVD